MTFETEREIQRFFFLLAVMKDISLEKTKVTPINLSKDQSSNNQGDLDQNRFSKKK